MSFNGFIFNYFRISFSSKGKVRTDYPDFRIIATVFYLILLIKRLWKNLTLHNATVLPQKWV